MLTRWGRYFILICSLVYFFVFRNGTYFKSCITSTLNGIELFGNSNGYHFLMFHKKEYNQRQNNLFRLLRQVQPSCDLNFVILLGKRNIKRSRDIEFNKDTDVRYFIGRNIPKEIYILENRNDTSSEVLIFTNQSSEMIQKSIFYTFAIEQIETVLRQRYDNINQSMVCLWQKTIDNNDDKADDIFVKEQPDHLFAFISSSFGVGEKRVMQLGYLTEMLRLIKSENEIRLLRQITKAVGEIFNEIMSWRITDRRIHVNQIAMFFEFKCKQLGGSGSIAFRPVINNGNSIKNRPHTSIDQMSTLKSTDWIMLDAGCLVNGYATDITRTWPLSGIAKLRNNYLDIYKTVLAAYNDCLSACHKGTSFETLDSLMLRSLSKGLKKLQIISDENLSYNETRELVRKFCPHYVGHHIGMNVHDSPSLHSGITFEPGMVITLEPGIYVPLGANFAPVSYHGISVRIENMILITKNGAEVLTSAAPIFKPLE